MSASWAVTAPCSNAAADSVDAELNIRALDASTPEGVGIRTACPLGASAVRIRIRCRPAAGPIGAKVARWLLHGMTVGTTASDWSSGVQLTDTSHASGSTAWTTGTTTVPISSLSIVAGQPCLLELVRDADDAGDTVANDIALLSVILDLI